MSENEINSTYSEDLALLIFSKQKGRELKSVTIKNECHWVNVEMVFMQGFVPIKIRYSGLNPKLYFKK